MLTYQTGVQFVTFAEGADTSSEINVEDSAIIGLWMPEAWTAAVVAFLVCYTGPTFVPCYDEGGQEITVEADTSRFVAINPSKLPGVTKVKLQSGATGATVNQEAARTVGVVYRKVA